MITFASYAFGCRVNMAEKEELDRQLLLKGWVYDEEQPDYFIINSCSVTRKAEREVRQKIYQIKRKFPQTKIIVTGCAATRWIKDKILIKEVDRLVDNVNKEYLAEILSKSLPADKQATAVLKNQLNNRLVDEICLIRESKKEIDFEKSGSCRGRVPSSRFKSLANQYKLSNQLSGARFNESRLGIPQPRHPQYINHDKFLNSGRLLVKIQDGCHRFCTYCIVPYLRGKPKSYSISYLVSSILEKAEKQDISEIILTAINTEAFGMDTGETLEDLLASILVKTKVSRISWGSINPWSLTDEFFKFYQKYIKSNRLVKFFHVPIQSGSDRILTLMKRGYTSAEILIKLDKLAELDECVLIGTDVIVGFPGETESDFSQTFEFIKKSPINKLHIFRWSPREHTATYFMAKKLKPVDEATKIKRAKILDELGRQKYQKLLASLVGQTFPALFLERQVEQYQEALLANQVRVLIKIDQIKAGDIKQVILEKLTDDYLYGKPVD